MQRNSKAETLFSLLVFKRCNEIREKIDLVKYSFFFFTYSLGEGPKAIRKSVIPIGHAYSFGIHNSVIFMHVFIDNVFVFGVAGNFSLNWNTHFFQGCVWFYHFINGVKIN